MPLETSYAGRQAGTVSAGSSVEQSGDYWPLHKLKKAYTDYLFSKREEIDEQINARRYYHGSQYTDEQLRILSKRKQPVMTFNRISRKIHGVVGLMERMRQDPKAFPRTPQHEEGAEVVTAVVRQVLDDERWEELSPLIQLEGAVDGIAGIELLIEQGKDGEPDVGMAVVDVPAFFYDPSSYEEDFSDAAYMGVGKWLTVDAAKKRWPKAEDSAFEDNSAELTTSTDRELRWFKTDGVNKKVRVIDIWYQHNGGWCWALFTGGAILEEGKSHLIDENDEPFCKFIMFSAAVDQDGDRYGFVRNMKSAQDGINAKQSKMQHILASNRLFIRKGAYQDVEAVRKEYARPDGVIESIGAPKEDIAESDRSFDFAGMDKMLERNLAEIENFGPNPALIGQGIENKSGRAIALLQQAGIAELGPYIGAVKSWKLRVYRSVWYAVQRFWKAERYIRVTDDEGLAQFFAINQLQIGPDGKPTITNAVGSMDVDLIMDEADDSINMQAEAFEILKALGPTFVERFPDVAIELAPFDASTKKMLRDRMEQASQSPQAQMQQAEQITKIEDQKAAAKLKEAQTVKTYVEAQVAPMEAMNGEGINVQPKDYEPPPEIQDAQAIAEIELTQAKTQSERAKAFKTEQDGRLAPQQLMADVANAQADRAQQAQQAGADRQFQARQSAADRKQTSQNADKDRQASMQQAKLKSKPKAK